jgi:hypothetical protein
MQDMLFLLELAIRFDLYGLFGLLLKSSDQVQKIFLFSSLPQITKYTNQPSLTNYKQPKL